MQDKGILPLAAMERLLKKAGAKRVSDNAKESLRKELERISQNIGEKAVRFANHSKRTTVKDRDIELAVK